MKKNILVTGGAGFIGSSLCLRLLENGEKVIAIDNFITSSGDNLKKLKKYPNFIFIKHDITKPLSTINRKLLSINQIYHLACPTGVPNLIPLSLEMLKTCSIGTEHVLELAKKNNAGMVFTSSSEMYGDPLIFPQNEEYTGNVNPVGIRSPYEEGKRFSESLIASYVRRFGMEVKIVRVFNTYGPGASLSETRVVPRLMRQALANKPLTVEGEGKQTRTFCYVDDLVNGLIIVMEKGIRGQVYNLGSDNETKIIDLAKLIIKISKSKSKIKFIPRPVHDHNRRHPDLSKVKKLGWTQTISLEDGLKEMV